MPFARALLFAAACWAVLLPRQSSEAASPPHRVIHLPTSEVDRLAAAGKFLPVPLAKLQQLLATDKSNDHPAVSLSTAEIAATLSPTGECAGTLRCGVTIGETSMPLLLFAPHDLQLTSVRFQTPQQDEPSPLAWGSFPTAEGWRTGTRVPANGTLILTWRGRRQQGDGVGTWRLPLATSYRGSWTSAEGKSPLALPIGQALSLPAGWLQRDNATARSTAVAEATHEWRLAPDAVEAQLRWSYTGLSPAVLDLPPELAVTAILQDGQPLPAELNGRGARLVFPSSGDGEPHELQVSVALPATGSGWQTLPWPRLQNQVQVTRDLRVLVEPPHLLAEVAAEGWTAVAEGPPASSSPSRHLRLLGDANAGIVRVRVEPSLPGWRAEHLTYLARSDAVTTATLAASLTRQGQATRQIRARLQPAWDIQRLEVLPNDLLSDWQPEENGDILLTLKRAVQPGESLQLYLRARLQRLIRWTPLSQAELRVLAIGDAAVHQRWLAVGGSERGLDLDLHPHSLLEPSTSSPPAALRKLASVPEGVEVVEPFSVQRVGGLRTMQSQRLAVAITSDLYRQERTVRDVTTINISPRGTPRQRLLVSFTQPGNGPRTWRQTAPTTRRVMARKLAESESSTGVETWEVTLPAPESEDFTLESTLVEPWQPGAVRLGFIASPCEQTGTVRSWGASDHDLAASPRHLKRQPPTRTGESLRREWTYDPEQLANSPEEPRLWRTALALDAAPMTIYSADHAWSWAKTGEVDASVLLRMTCFGSTTERIELPANATLVSWQTTGCDAEPLPSDQRVGLRVRMVEAEGDVAVLVRYRFPAESLQHGQRPSFLLPGYTRKPWVERLRLDVPPEFRLVASTVRQAEHTLQGRWWGNLLTTTANTAVATPAAADLSLRLPSPPPGWNSVRCDPSGWPPLVLTASSNSSVKLWFWTVLVVAAIWWCPRLRLDWVAAGMLLVALVLCIAPLPWVAIVRSVAWGAAIGATIRFVALFARASLRDWRANQLRQRRARGPATAMLALLCWSAVAIGGLAQPPKQQAEATTPTAPLGGEQPETWIVLPTSDDEPRVAFVHEQLYRKLLAAESARNAAGVMVTDATYEPNATEDGITAWTIRWSLESTTARARIDLPLPIALPPRRNAREPTVTQLAVNGIPRPVANLAAPGSRLPVTLSGQGRHRVAVTVSVPPTEARSAWRLPNVRPAQLLAPSAEFADSLQVDLVPQRSRIPRWQAQTVGQPGRKLDLAAGAVVTWQPNTATPNAGDQTLLQHWLHRTDGTTSLAVRISAPQPTTGDASLRLRIPSGWILQSPSPAGQSPSPAGQSPSPAGAESARTAREVDLAWSGEPVRMQLVPTDELSWGRTSLPVVVPVGDQPRRIEYGISTDTTARVIVADAGSTNPLPSESFLADWQPDLPAADLAVAFRLPRTVPPSMAWAMFAPVRLSSRYRVEQTLIALPDRMSLAATLVCRRAYQRVLRVRLPAGFVATAVASTGADAPRVQAWQQAGGGDLIVELAALPPPEFRLAISATSSAKPQAGEETAAASVSWPAAERTSLLMHLAAAPQFSASIRRDEAWQPVNSSNPPPPGTRWLGHFACEGEATVAGDQPLAVTIRENQPRLATTAVTSFVRQAAGIWEAKVSLFARVQDGEIERLRLAVPEAWHQAAFLEGPQIASVRAITHGGKPYLLVELREPTTGWVTLQLARRLAPDELAWELQREPAIVGARDEARFVAVWAESDRALPEFTTRGLTRVQSVTTDADVSFLPPSASLFRETSPRALLSVQAERSDVPPSVLAARSWPLLDAEAASLVATEMLISPAGAETITLDLPAELTWRWLACNQQPQVVPQGDGNRIVLRCEDRQLPQHLLLVTGGPVDVSRDIALTLDGRQLALPAETTASELLTPNQRVAAGLAFWSEGLAVAAPAIAKANPATREVWYTTLSPEIQRLLADAKSLAATGGSSELGAALASFQQLQAELQLTSRQPTTKPRGRISLELPAALAGRLDQPPAVSGARWALVVGLLLAAIAAAWWWRGCDFDETLRDWPVLGVAGIAMVLGLSLGSTWLVSMAALVLVGVSLLMFFAAGSLDQPAPGA